METDLGQAFHGVYNSSKEILKNNQRHIYCNMLDLLTNTCRTTGIVGSNVFIDDVVNFWLADILPLTFDKDTAIQASAIAALDVGLSTLDVSRIHASVNWPELKNKIVLTYASLIHKLREERNKNWYKIWCLLIRTLDRDILKGASTINSFLSVVELGFRNPDNVVRAEAFTCWRLLIKIFSFYDELLSPKRLKLVCIPLKSSQSKSPHLAEVKFRVWWYLLTRLEAKLSQNFELVLEPFLAFCFGSSRTTRNLNGVAQQYSSVREISLICLLTLLSTETNEFIENLLHENDLETIFMPSPLLEPTLLQQHWETIFNASFEAVRMLISDDDVILHTELLRLILNAMLRLDVSPFAEKFFNELVRFLPAYPRPIIFILNSIASDGLIYERCLQDTQSFSEVIGGLMNVLIASKKFSPPTIYQRSIDKIFHLGMFRRLKCNQWRAFSIVLNLILQTETVENTDIFEATFLIWRRVSQSVLEHLNDNNIDYRIKEFSDILNKSILWPLHAVIAMKQRSSVCFSRNFCEIWKHLLIAGQNSSDRGGYISKIEKALFDLFSLYHDNIFICGLLEAYAIAIIKYNDIDHDITCIHDSFVLFNKIFALSLSSQVVESCLNTARYVLLGIKQRDLTVTYSIIKTLHKEIIRLMTNGCISKTYAEEWKRSILEKLRSHPQKEIVSQIKDLFKEKDEFVIIPSVWSLNPDKLTERQKERFAERADIPALYNDISQSQESSIKPWTPKKVVIAKGDEAEIILSGKVEKGLQNNEERYNVQQLPLTTLVQQKELRIAKKNNIVKTSKKLNYNRLNDGMDVSEKNGQSSFVVSAEAQLSHNSDNISKQTRRSFIRIKQQISNIKEANVVTNSETSKFDLLHVTNHSKDVACGENINLVSFELDKNVLNKEDKTVNNAILSKSARDFEKETLVEMKDSIAQEQNPHDQFLEVNENTNKEHSAMNPENMPNFEIIKAEISPRKGSSVKFSHLLSPPDRRLTNNSFSPTLRSKPSSHLTGRGAQLINMIRNKKIDACGVPSSKSNNIKKDNIPSFEILELSVTSTPIFQHDVLTFSKRLPSPSASPSASILKRKIRRESLEDLSMESPAFKRKRVSFHDPPVSITKEYFKDSEENKIKPKRCLILDKGNMISGQETKHVLKRRSKIDSMIEIERFSSDHSLRTPSSEADISDNNSSLVSKLQYNNDKNTFCRDTSQQRSIERENKSTQLDYVIQNFSLEEMLNRYFSKDDALHVQLTNVLAKFVSTCMSSNTKIKSNVLEILSENHSKDFLDHAVQENLSSVVCDRLNLNSVIDYVCAKSKINALCRNYLLLQLSDILMHNKQESERVEFLKTILQNNCFTDNNIVDLIAILIHTRPTMNANPAHCVSESAVDSSSNL